MDYPGDFCYGVSLHIGGAFMAKFFTKLLLFYELFLPIKIFIILTLFSLSRGVG